MFPIFSQNVEMTQVWPRKSETWEEEERADVPVLRSYAFFSRVNRAWHELWSRAA